MLSAQLPVADGPYLDRSVPRGRSLGCHLDRLVEIAALDGESTDHPLAAGEYQGRDAAARLLAVAVFRPGRTFRLIATRANRQPAFGVYVRDSHATIARANGLLVLTLTGSQISALTRFDNSALTSFGLPAP